MRRGVVTHMTSANIVFRFRSVYQAFVLNGLILIFLKQRSFILKFRHENML